LKSKVVYP